MVTCDKKISQSEVSEIGFTVVEFALSSNLVQTFVQTECSRVWSSYQQKKTSFAGILSPASDQVSVKP